ncbi:Gamma-D-glutamyl-L-diamino acid endopeptidase 1 [Bacillus sp. THAF10]|nr:M14 family metallopeptidase [Bacillus sp. THAF10]QFT89829.1 Gamma-D-glutamyl-L-diamino acid endopeptidase 1 [Bacillus sp. THAF10]
MLVDARRGDSLWYISTLFKLPLELMMDSNPHVKKEDKEALGQKIAIPGYTSTKYLVKQGDTVQSIANEFGLPLDTLYLLNQNMSLAQLNIEDEIRMPMKVKKAFLTTKKHYDSAALEQDIKELVRIFPFVKCNSIGQSVLNNPIYQLKIGMGTKKIHWNASFHANEWITSAVTMNLLQDYLLALTKGETIRGVSAMSLYHQATISIVPMVNPDGVDLVLNGPPVHSPFEKLVTEINIDKPDFLNWKANIRGIDLNKHFPANWEIEKNRKEEKTPSPRDFPGFSPLTEPEAKAMEALTRAEDFDMVIAVHTQGEEFYWGYEGFEPKESEKMAEEFERVSTYKSVRYVDSHAGFKDWFIQEFRKPGFTLELGRGINPLPLSQYDTIYKKTLGIFIAALYV